MREYKTWTQQEDVALRELIDTKKYSFKQMAIFLPGRTAASCQKRSLRLGISRDDYTFTKHSYNRAFFAKPNPVNCYVAGYYAADGSIVDNTTTRVMCLELSHKEWHQLEIFKKLFEYTGQVKDSSYSYRPNMCALRLYAAHEITDDLERHFGLSPKKTYRLPAPSITDPDLQLCYLAGLLDGDGCVHISNTGKLHISYLSCSKEIVEWVKSFTDSLDLKAISRKGGKVRDDRPRSNAWKYQIVGAKAVDLVKRIQKLKDRGIPILDRKWDNDRLNTYIRDFEIKHQITFDAQSATPHLYHHHLGALYRV